MKNLNRACSVAVEKRKNDYGSQSKAIKIRRIGETDELYIISFYTEGNDVVYGGGGLIVYKKDFSVDHYCIPSYPQNIFEIIDNAVDVAIPKEYQ